MTAERNADGQIDNYGKNFALNRDNRERNILAVSRLSAVLFEHDVTHDSNRDNGQLRDERRQSEFDCFAEFAHIGLKAVNAEVESFGFARHVKRANRKRQGLTDNGRPRRARHAHAEREYKHRVENNVGNRADKQRRHRPRRTAVRANNPVYHVHSHKHGHKAEHNIEVFDGKIYSVFGRAEKIQERAFYRVKQRKHARAENDGKYYARAHCAMRAVGVVLALTNIKERGATVAQPPRKRLRDYKHGKNYARRGVAEIPRGAVSYKYLIDNVVQRGNEHRQNARHRKLNHQLKQLAFAEFGIGLFHKK